ncbi:myxalamid-type polyketide synthase MxaB [Tahibacter aquaticus]|uniref:Myxalamid-type polyketide synthase MxaB n=1 Tax=Tahibacter aquaticus TaxID=520092 RepID=A0A4R6YU74_9GAMM|nr:type I polyketide synthase [Tahibacter aquaticus]TDR42080.1 myxalamid-type polyketide synthase MxaB [Tahibacter aquaticus]
MTDLPEKPADTLKKTFIALKRAQARVEALEARRAEPIAIVGIGCRLPGGADSPAALWDLLCRETDTARAVPADRWPEQSFYSQSADASGRTHAARAHFLDGHVDAFDAPFFGISAKEAVAMDPQQRLLLELGWEALEDAGIDPASLRGTPTGVFVGISSDDYAQAHRHSGRLDLIDGYSLTGTCLAPAAGRMSYTFGFEGPSMAIDTACSSSLVAVHLACQSLRSGETDVALAAGVNLILSPVFHIASSKLGTISPDGLCKTFDASADGYGRGEGCGVIVLKRLADARTDGDRILAVIRSSAVNQDGKSNGLTAPNGLAQERVIREALDRAGLAPEDIGYIEVHGTGTSLGDPIEVEAIGRVQASRPADRPVVLGTVKSNIGHLEAAAGIAGLIRAVEILRRGEIPAHLHLDNPSPHIPWGAYPFEVRTERKAWVGEGPRRAGVSSFGFSGTNAHVILEQAPEAAPAVAAQAVATPAVAESGPVLLPLSARTAEGLAELAARWRDWLAAGHAPLADAAATAAAGRSHLAQRLAVVGADTQEVAAAIAAFLDGKPARNLASGSAGTRPKIAGLFTGQGSQYPGMGRDLYDSEPVFRATIDACDGAIGDRLGKRLLDLLYGADTSDAELQQTGFAQPAIFAVELALYRLWESWGVVPDLVCGHSIGEFAAAHVAGILGFEDAIDLVCARGRLMQSLPAGGTMAAVFASESVVASMLAPGSGVSIAAVNTPNDVVVSGPETAVAELVARLAASSIGVQSLRVSHAFHSALMRPIVAEFARLAERPAGEAVLPFFSTVSAARMAPDKLGARYWGAQIEAPVRFAATAQAMAAEGATVFLEYGPAAVLAGLARQSVEGEGLQFLGSLQRGGDGRRAMLGSLARLYAQGLDPHWKAVVTPARAGRAAIPTYPFQRKRYYRAPIVDAGRHAGAAGAASGGHPYLGQRIHSRLLPKGAALHQALFTAENPAFLVEHQIFGKIISPAAAHLSMAFAAAGGGASLEDVSFTAPLVVDAEAARIVQLAIEGDGVGYSLASQPVDKPGDVWTVHSAGRIAAPATAPEALDLAAIRARCSGTMAPADFYALIETLGYRTGAHFQCIREIAKSAGEALCRIVAVDAIDAGAIHPGLIDSMLQTVLPACESDAAHMLDGESVLIPLHMAQVAIHGSLDQPLWCHSRVAVAGELVKAQLTVCDEAGVPVLAIGDFLLKRTDRATLYQELGDGDRALVHAIDWQPITLAAPAAAPDGWIVFADQDGWGSAVAARLLQSALPCLELRRGEAEPARFAEVATAWAAGHGVERANILFAWGGAGADPEAETCGTLAALLPAVQALGSGTTPLRARLWLLSRQVQQVVPEDGGAALPLLDGGALWGMGRAIANEMPHIWGGLLDVEAKPSDAGAAAIVAAALSPAGEDQLAIRRHGQCFAARLVPAVPAPALPELGESERYRLDKGPRRTLDDLRFERLARSAPRSGEVEIEVLAAGLNFRDVLNALGQYPGEAGLLGFEAVGRVTALGPDVAGLAIGDSVIALAAPGCIGSHVTVRRALVVRKPEALSAAEAVALPAALLTAYYALHHLGGIKAGDRVLIHAAAGGVGMAAVQLALAAGAEVFATAGAPEKQQFVRDMGVAHVMSSRTLDFADRIRAITGGRGVDMVLNSLSGDFITESFGVLAAGGRFLEMGKIGIWDEARVQAQDPSWVYRPFDLAAVALEDPATLVAMFDGLLEEVAAGRLVPLPVTVFPMADAEQAFRFMAQARHIGKIVLSREQESRRTRLATRGVHGDAHYLITGGLGALGLRVAQRLVEEGARHLVLSGRRGPGESARSAIAELEAAGARVTIVEGDVAVADDAARMVAAASSPPLAGVIHAAGLLEDGMIADLDADRLARVLAPKVAGGWNLHRATETLDLDFFLLFSSVAAIIGNLGQGAYAAGNAFLDGLASWRRRRGLAATSLNWGPWAEAGMAAALKNDRFAAMGIRQLAPAQGLRTMLRLIGESPMQAVVAEIDWAAYGRAQGIAGGSGLFAAVVDAPDAAATASAEGPAARDILAELAAALPAQREGVMRTYLQELARQTLGYGRGETIAPDKPLAEQGFDSLMSVEMRNRLNRALGRKLAASLLFDYPTLDRIGRHLLDSLLPAEVAAAAPSAADILDEIESLIGRSSVHTAAES